MALDFKTLFLLLDSPFLKIQLMKHRRRRRMKRNYLKLQPRDAVSAHCGRGSICVVDCITFQFVYNQFLYLLSSYFYHKMVCCCVYGCSNRPERGNVSFHKFPVDPELRALWVKAVNRKNWEPTPYSRICSDHFLPKDLNKTYKCGRVILREGVVPCIFPTNPTYVHPNKNENDLSLNENGTEEFKTKNRLICDVVVLLNSEEEDAEMSQYKVHMENFNKENSKDYWGGKDLSKSVEIIRNQNSDSHIKTNGTLEGENNKSVKNEIEMERNSTENIKCIDLLSEIKNGKEFNSKEMTLKKNSLSKKSLSIEETSPIKLNKEKSIILNNKAIKSGHHRHNINNKKIVDEENKIEILDEKLNIDNDALTGISKEKLTCQIINKSNKKESNEKKSHQVIRSKKQMNIMKDNCKVKSELTKSEIEYNKEEKMSRKIFNGKVKLYKNSENVNNNEKSSKRKSLMRNKNPPKKKKKRIRLGKDDTEESDDSTHDCQKTSNVSRDKITYKCPSEMADNEDLLRYLKYLKDKSKSYDQPVLFLVDD